jgi:hypothetical protein
LRDVHHPTRRRLRWDLKVLFAHYDDEWYASLFEEGGDRVRGEITPSYSLLNQDDIQHIKDIMPGVKILFLIRNPVDRAWSALRFGSWRRHGGQPPGSLNHLKRAVEKEGRVLRGDYVRVITSWRACFPQEQVFIGFFDDILLNPQLFLFTVFEFLQVDASEEYLHQIASRKINPSPEKAMPPEFRLYLAKRYYSQVQALSEMLGGHATRWLEEYEELFRQDAS